MLKWLDNCWHFNIYEQDKFRAQLSPWRILYGSLAEVSMIFLWPLGPDQGQLSIIRLTSNSLEFKKNGQGRAGQNRTGQGGAGRGGAEQSRAILEWSGKWICNEQNYGLDYWFNALYEACGG